MVNSKILHVLVMLLQPRRDITQLVINIGHGPFRVRGLEPELRTPENNLRLAVQQEFSVESFRAVGRNLRVNPTTVAAGIAGWKDHGCTLDRRPSMSSMLLMAAIVLGAIVLPGSGTRHPRRQSPTARCGPAKSPRLAWLLDGFLVVEQ